MRTILVASSKGGCGKSTIATNLAAAWAIRGKRTALVDADPQRSATHWCEKRMAFEHAVLPIPGTRRDWPQRLPPDTQRVVIDGPAGATVRSLDVALEQADAVLVPVLPSVFDLEACSAFLDTLATHPRVRQGTLPVGLVANRIRPWTATTQQVLEQLRDWPYPLVAQLRDTQAYVLLAGLGRSLFDYHSEQVRSHQDDWTPLFRWIKRVT